MRKIILSLLLIGTSYGLSFGKPVDENTAKTIGFNYLLNQGKSLKQSEMSLVYLATSDINGATLTDFYVFNAANGGFVIVAADDKVLPILAFDLSTSFNANNLYVNVNDWMNTTKKEINAAVTNNSAGNAATASQWTVLSQSRPASAARTTSTTSYAAPLVHSIWNQSPYVNQLCPYDVTDSALTVTGCVATAMAQVMKYWGWPVTGTGTNTYSCAYGMLTADFGTETYKWDSMPNNVTDTNLFVANLMLAAGISVNMNYGVTGSSAGFDIASTFGTNCAEYALQTYFSYQPSTIQGVSRDSYDDTGWLNLIMSEVDAKRPVLYDGFGSDGGHAYIADGYSGYLIHFNWGWGGYCNGYFNVDNLNPGGASFNSDQHLIIGIMPDTVTIPPATPPSTGVQQVTANGLISIYPNPATDVINIDLQGTKVTQVRLMDMQGRVLTTSTPATTASIITIPVIAYTDGMYLVELQTTKGIRTKQIVIAR